MSIVETPVSKENAHIYTRKIREHVGDALQRVEAWWWWEWEEQGEGHKSIKQKKVKPKN